MRCILPLSPDNFTHNVWGGTWIPKFKKWPIAQDARIGESWEFSGHPHHPSRVLVEDGKWVALNQLLKIRGKLLLGKRLVKKTKSSAPFLIKFIDAADDLSIQVHPNDSYALQYEKDHGKDESWVILETIKKGQGIYLGFKKDGPTRQSSARHLKAGFAQAISEANALGPSHQGSLRKRAAAIILPFLNAISVRPGEVFNLKAGLVHAIGKGVRLFEIQQPSDLTYRVWDWNRPDPEWERRGRMHFRHLHIDKAIEVIDFIPHPPSYFRDRPQKIAGAKGGSYYEEQILKNPNGHFAVNRIHLKGKGSKSLKKGKPGFAVLTVIKGHLGIRSYGPEGGLPYEESNLQTGFSCLIPAHLKSYELVAESADAVVFKSYVPGY